MDKEHYRALCDCGEPAVVTKGREPVCLGCAQKDKNVTAIRSQTHCGVRQKLGHGSALRDWSRGLDDYQPICGGSLKILEKMLVKV